MSEPNWSDVLAAFVDAFQPMLEDVWEEAKVDMTALGERAVTYLKAQAQGDPSAGVCLDSVQRQARLIAARYLRDASAAFAQGFENAVVIALKVLGRLLTKVVT